MDSKPDTNKTNSLDFSQNTPNNESPNKLESWLQLNRTRGIGPKTAKSLLEYFSDPETTLNASIAELKSTGLSQTVAEAIKSPDKKGVDEDLAWLESHEHHHILTQDDPRYPPLLSELCDPPLILYVNGNPAWLCLPQLAIVGSRSASPGGLHIASEFAFELAELGLVITSGLALGIDAAAHQGALKSSGKTVAVLGTGPDRIYPAKHLELASEVVSSGVIVSEFVPGTTPRKENFPRRNRLISGLSAGTLVVEATQQSGSLITARYAMEQGREVFAVPGSIRNPHTKGCHALIRDGAKLVESVDDIVEDLLPIMQLTLEQIGRKPTDQQEQITSQPDENSHKILESLGYDPLPIDVLVERTGLTARELSSMLLSLELEGRVTSQAGGMYVRNQ